MTHLSQEEAEAFYLASLREFDLGSIGDHGFRDRMRSLADMLPDELAALLRQEIGLDDRRSSNGEQDEDNGAEASINALEDGGNAGNRGASSPPVLELVVQNVRA